MNAATEELQKVRSTLTSQATSLRRQKERSEQLEDVIIDLKHELDAATAGKASAEDAVSKAKASANHKLTKLKAAEAAVEEARDELAQERAKQSAKSNAAQADIQSMLQSMQRQSDKALEALEQAHAVQLNDLQNRLSAVQAERNDLLEKLHSTQLQLNAPDQAQSTQTGASTGEQSAETGAVVQKPSSSSSRAASPEAAASQQASIEELQQRNNRLQMALAAKRTAVRPAQELLDEVLPSSPLSICTSKQIPLCNAGICQLYLTKHNVAVNMLRIRAQIEGTVQSCFSSLFWMVPVRHCDIAQ